MEALECIYTRRSVRSFNSREIDDDTVEKILDAAMLAPSAGNEQPWHFVVIKERSILEEIPNIHPYAAMVRDASMAILVCGDPSLERHSGFWVQDCAAAVENILLAVRALDLGAVWVGIHPVEERVQLFRSLCLVPQKVIPFAIVPIGYPLVDQKMQKRYNAHRVHHDRW